jgi:hypothetical protein
MNKKRLFTIALVPLLIGLMLISQAKAETSKPSVPEFIAEYVHNSYDIAPTYTIDPYTNNTLIQTIGKHVDNRTLVITIENEPFTPFNDSQGNTINMFYNVRYKGTFGQNWTEVYEGQRIVMYNFDNPDDYYGYKIQNYFSQNTIVAIPSPAQQGQMDVQVEALKGYTHQTQIRGSVIAAVIIYGFFGEGSGWSNTQTVTLGEISAVTPSPSFSPSPSETPSLAPTPSPSPSPTLNPTVLPTTEPSSTPTTKPNTGFLGTNLPTEYGCALIAVVVVAIAALTLIMLRKRHSRQSAT